MMLTRDQILAKDDIKRVVVKVPEWDGEVFVKVLTGSERDAFEASLIIDGKASLGNSRAKLAVACVTDESGAQLFAPDDIEMLGAKSSVALERVARAAQRLNKMSDKDLEDLKGN